MRGKQNICVLAAVSFYQQRQQFWRSPPSSCCGVLLQAVAAVAFSAFFSDEERGVLGSLFQPPGAAAAAVYSEQHVFFRGCSRAEPPAAAATTSHPIDATSCLSGVVRATVAVGASMTYWASHRGQMPRSFVVGDWCLLMSTCHYALVRAARRRRREAGKTSPTSGRRRRDVGRARSGCCRRASRGGFRPAQDAIVDEQESRGGRAVENTLGKASGDELEEVAFAAATPASTCRGRTPPPSTRWGRLLLPSTRRGGEAVLGAQGRLPAPSSLRRWSTRRRLPRAGRLLTISRWRDIDNLYKTLKKNIKEIDKDAKFYDNMSSKMDKPLAEECWSEIEAWEHGCRQCTG